MAFSETTKIEAKRRANYRCVVCQQPWVEVHHIIPEKDDGSDEIENAAPLCGSCHQQFGGNPDLRKQLREMRDHWWMRCEASNTNPEAKALGEKLDEIKTQLISGSARQEVMLDEVKVWFLDHLRSMGDTINSAKTIGEVLSTAGAFSSGSTVYPILGNRADQIPSQCYRCGYVAVYGSKCEHCGAMVDD